MYSNRCFICLGVGDIYVEGWSILTIHQNVNSEMNAPLY